MRDIARKALHALLIASASIGAVLLGRLLLAESLNDRVPLFLPLIVAIFLAAWFGGFRAGLVATALSVGLGTALANGTAPNAPISERMRLIVFVLEGLAISCSFESMHRARVRLVRKQQQLQEEIRERKRVELELVDADRRKNEFLATLAHELRNPLAPICYSLEIGRHPQADRATLANAHATVERQVQQLVRLVDDLLDVSRITRNKLELRKQSVDLATVIHSAVETSRPLLDAAGHVLTVTQPPGPILVDADPVRLAQVFSNLLNNAAKYMDAGGHVWLTLERAGAEVTVKIRDTGIGIPAHMMSHIFDMFTQVDHSLERSQGGLGIGLTLVKRLTEMHNGRVEVRSEPGRGSEFIVRLPILSASETLVQPNGDRPVVSGRRVLVVDDNEDAATSMQAMLTSLGNDVRTAGDGLEALETAATFQPEVVLLDVRMPRLNGYDAARRIRSEPWGKEMVLIAHTGWGQEEDRQRTREAGFDYHLVKPVAVDALERLLAGLPK